MNINDFKSQITSMGGSRPNLFEVTLNPKFGTPFTYMCKAASIPASTIASVDVNYMGRIVKVPGNRTYEDWTITVINDEEFSIRTAFENWMAEINHPASNRTGASSIGIGSSVVGEISTAAVNTIMSSMGLGSSGGFGDNTITATVRQLKMDGTFVTNGAYHLINLFPTEIEAIDLNWGTNDEIEEFTVTFAYDYWTHTSGTSTVSRAAGAAKDFLNNEINQGIRQITA